MTLDTQLDPVSLVLDYITSFELLVQEGEYGHEGGLACHWVMNGRLQDANLELKDVFKDTDLLHVSRTWVSQQ